MLTITLPEHLTGSRIFAGIEFAGGTATVETLGSHSQRFFELVGATIAEYSASVEADADPFAELRIGDRLLKDLKVQELRDLAGTEGLELDAKATKPEILNSFLTAFTSKE